MPTFADKHTPSQRVSRAVSAMMVCVCAVFTLTILGVLGLVIGYLFQRGFGALSLDFFTQLPTGDPNDPGGMKNGILGTTILIGLASIIGIPFGVLTGIYLSEYPDDRAFTNPVRFICDVLAGVPSIVVGILGYELLVVPLGTYSGWAGAGALAFIMVPIVARTTEEMLSLVPRSYREGSLALGATKSQTIFRVVLPSATGSVITGVLLALARISGETAPLLFTAGYSRLLTTNPAEPFPSLTIQIYKASQDASPGQQQLAWAGMLVLVTLFLILSAAIRVLASRTVRVAS